jgi:NurA-like 5'-3' nuclease
MKKTETIFLVEQLNNNSIWEVITVPFVKQSDAVEQYKTLRNQHPIIRFRVTKITKEVVKESPSVVINIEGRG